MSGAPQGVLRHQDRFLVARRKLSDLGYTHTFTVESLDMVEQLLGDLTTTSQSYHQLQEREQRLLGDLNAVQAQLFPLRKDNARLLRENHELHVDQIKTAEASRREQEQHRRQLTVLRDELAEARLLLRVTQDELRARDTALDQLRDAYDAATDPALRAKVPLLGVAKISSKRPSGSDVTTQPRPPVDDGTQRQQAEVAAVVTLLQTQLQQSEEVLRRTQEENNRLQLAISAREQELARATKIIGDGAQNPGAASTTALRPADSDQLANKRIIEQLNGQVDFLNNQLARREAQLAQVSQRLATFNALEVDLKQHQTAIHFLKEENAKLSERNKALEKKATPTTPDVASAAPRSGSRGIEEQKRQETQPSTPPPQLMLASGRTWAQDRATQAEQALADAGVGTTAAPPSIAIAAVNELTSATREEGRLRAMLQSTAQELMDLRETQKRTQKSLEEATQQLAKRAEELQLMTDKHAQTSIQLKTVQTELFVLRQELMHTEQELHVIQEAELTQQLRRDDSDRQLQQQQLRLQQSAALAKVDREDWQRELEETQRANEELRAELRLWTERYRVVCEEKQRANEETESKASDATRQQEQTSQTKRELQKLQRELKTLRETCDQQAVKLLRCEEKLEQERLRRVSADGDVRQLKQEKADLETQLEQLHDLIQKMENSDQVNAQKLRTTERILQQTKNAHDVLTDEKQQHLSTIHTQQGTISQLRLTIQEVDRARDELQSQLDDAEDELAALKQEGTQLQVKNQQLQSLVQQLERKQQQLSKELQASQQMAQGLDLKLQGLVAENGELKGKLKLRVQAEGNAAEDLMLLTRENQALTSELAAVAAERDQAALRLQELQRQHQDALTAKHAIEIERQELVENYRVVIKEKRKLQEELIGLSKIMTEGRHETQHMQQVVAELQTTNQSYVQAHEKWSRDKAAMMGQFEVLNDRFNRLQQRIDELESENRRLLQEAHSAKQSNAMLNDRLALVMKRATATNEASKVLSSRLTAVERERDAAKAVLEIERQRAQDMAKVAETARIEVATKEIQIQRLRAELHELSQDSGSSRGRVTSTRSSPQLAGEENASA